MMYPKTIASFLNLQLVGIFKALDITKLENIFESLTDIGKQFNSSWYFYFIIIYVHNVELHVLTLFFLPILFLTFIESIFEKEKM